MIGTFARGLAVGFAIAAPVGPIGMLCIRRTLVQGPAAGLATGLGAATADAAYGFVAALGLGALANALIGHAAPLRIAGALLLAWLGITSVRRALRRQLPGSAAVVTGRGGLVAAWASTLVLTLANPMTILSFAGVVAALAGRGGGMWLVAGVFAGSTAWWLLLVGGVSLVRHALPLVALRWIGAISGTALLGFAAYALAG